MLLINLKQKEIFRYTCFCYVFTARPLLNQFDAHNCASSNEPWPFGTLGNLSMAALISVINMAIKASLLYDIPLGEKNVCSFKPSFHAGGSSSLTSSYGPRWY